MDKFTILYLCDYALDKIGGAQKSLLTMAYSMNELGYRIITTSDLIKDLSKIDKNKIIIEQWKKPSNKYLMFLSKIILLRKCIKKYNIDIIHAQFSQYAFVALLARKYHLISRKIPLVFTDRHYFLGYNNRYKHTFVDNINYFNHIVFTTQNNKSEWEKALGSKPHCKFDVVNNVLEDHWYNNDCCKSKELEKFIVVGYAGRYVDWKRWDTVMEITKLLCENKNIMISIAISGDKEADEFIEKLRSVSHEQLIVRKNASENEMKQFYADLDFFVLTSENESFGRTLIEAMTKNTVVLSTASGGAPEVVGRDDVLFPVGDYKAACQIIKNISNSKETIDKYKKWFSERSKIYRVENMQGNMDRIYKDVMKNFNYCK